MGCSGCEVLIYPMHRCHSQEDDTSRVDLVAEAIQKAKQEAEMLKAKKRLEKLAAAGHDITNLQAAYEGELSCSPRPISSSDQLKIAHTTKIK